MEKIINNNGIPFDAKYEVGFDENKEGLILHARSGKTNSEYNDALQVILNRLKKSRISYVDIFIVSKNLLKVFQARDRQILLNNQTISLNTDDIKNLRIKIGSAQCKIKVDVSTKGGNPTKRILLHHPDISKEFWKKLALNIVEQLPNSKTTT